MFSLDMRKKNAPPSRNTVSDLPVGRPWGIDVWPALPVRHQTNPAKNGWLDLHCLGLSPFCTPPAFPGAPKRWRSAAAESRSAAKRSNCLVCQGAPCILCTRRTRHLVVSQFEFFVQI